jgi:hypothetical protein
MRLAQSSPSADEIQPRVGHVLVKNGEGQMIKKVKEGYKVTSSKGKNLGGPYKSKAAAQKRLRQVEYFKRAK